MDVIYHFSQIIYWIALSTWFGGVLFVAIAAPVIFRTVREGDPVLPLVLSVNLEGQHSTLLAGSIVANILKALGRVAPLCAAALLLTLLVQWLILPLTNMELAMMLLRSVLFLAAVVFMAWDRWLVWPKIWKYRQEFLDHADEPEIANTARERFDRYHRHSIVLLMFTLAALLGMILFSATIPYDNHTPRFYGTIILPEHP